MIDSYHIFVLTFLSIAGYIFSVVLVRKKILALIIHRRIWNYILLISFLISGLLGLVLAFFIDYRLSVAWYREFLWLHVESGIVMAIISLFHIGWHWRYFKQKKIAK
jgi:spermidine synthase